MKDLFKKSISFALSFLMIASFVPAEALEVGSRDEAEVIVTVGDATISEMGTTVDVPVSIEFKDADAKIDTFGLGFDFDSDNFVMHESTGRRDPVITVGDDTLCTSVTGNAALKRATYADDSGFGLDKALAEECKAFVPNIEAVVVKEGRSRFSAVSVHPTVVREMIYNGVKAALARRDEIKPIECAETLTMEIDFKDSNMADTASLVPGVVRLAPRTVSFTGDPETVFKVHELLIFRLVDAYNL